MIFGDNQSTDYGRQALMRVEDIEARLNRQLRPQFDTSAVLKGQPQVLLDGRELVLGRVSCSSSRLLLIFKHTGEAKVELVVNGLVAMADDSGMGLSFASISVVANQETSIVLRGMGRVESYELLLSGENVRADGTARFGFDCNQDMGVCVTTQGGSIYLTAIVGDEITPPVALIAGIAADVVAVESGFFVAVVDNLSNLWWVQLDSNLDTVRITHLEANIDSVAISSHGDKILIAILRQRSVLVGTVKGNTLGNMKTLDIGRLRDIQWAKRRQTPMLLATATDNSTTGRVAFDVDNYESPLRMKMEIIIE